MENSQSSNSESLPDLKWNTNRSSHYLRTIRRESPVCHSFSDPDIVRSARPKDQKYLKKNRTKRILPTALMERLQVAATHRVVTSSNSDCSEQSGWISSTASSRPNSPPAIDDEPYQLETAPLAPPEEFQVSTKLTISLLDESDPWIRFYNFIIINWAEFKITKQIFFLFFFFLQWLHDIQDPPRANYFSVPFSFNSKMTSPKHQVPMEGTRGTYTSIPVDDDTSGHQSIENRTKGRPLSHEV